MKKTIVVCDKCGRELLPGEEVVRMDLDLCEECENELLNIVQLWVDGEFFSVNVPEEKPKSQFEINQEKKKRELQLVEESCEKVVNQIMEAEKPKTSVVAVEVAPDLKTCKAYISVLGDEEAQKSTYKGLRSAEGFIRSLLAKRINLRNTPAITFVMDNSIEYGVNMYKLIEDVNHKDDQS